MKYEYMILCRCIIKKIIYNKKEKNKMQKVSLSASLNRWLFSTNAKDIAVLYFIFALFSGILGSLMSLVIRLELSAPGNQILGGNNQLFNVLVTAHAILMVFFLIMPVTMGFFGKKVNKYLYIKRNILTENKNEKKLNNYENLGHYLAGLIEGDGTILVQEDVDITLNRKYNPMISIAFHKKDKELAEYLCKELKIGKVYEKKGNYVLWVIAKIEDLYILVSIINGKFRTPKHEALVRLINWINNYIIENKTREWNLKNPLNVLNKNRLDNILSNIEILPVLGLDTSELNENGWLSGFTDADGNFSIILSVRKNNKSRVDLSYRLEIQQNLKKEVVLTSYKAIMLKIAKLFNTGIYVRVRNLKVVKSLEYKNYETYTVSVNSLINLKSVDEYFIKYPLLSSKYLDYKDWSYLLNLKLDNKYDNQELFKKGQKIRTNFNSTRKIVSLNHISENILKYNI